MALVRLLALLTAAGLATVLTMLVWLPVSRWLIGAVFDGDGLRAGLPACSWAWPCPWPFWPPAAAYQFTRRADLSLVLFAAFAGLSLTVWADDWQLCWLNPCVWAMSDDFTNFRHLPHGGLYAPDLAGGILAGVWAVSYLCIRRYGKGPFGSLARSVRRVYRPGHRPGPAGLLRHRLCRPALFRQQQPGPDSAMHLYELDYAEGVTCSGPHRPGVPGHQAPAP